MSALKGVLGWVQALGPLVLMGVAAEKGHLPATLVGVAFYLGNEIRWASERLSKGGK